jgi:hypothetical protein
MKKSEVSKIEQLCQRYDTAAGALSELIKQRTAKKKKDYDDGAYAVVLSVFNVHGDSYDVGLDPLAVETVLTDVIGATEDELSEYGVELED